MSIQAVYEFIHKVGTDQGLQAKLEEVSTAEPQAMLAGVVQVAAEANFAFSAQEYQATIKQELTRLQVAGELSIEEVNRHGGGYLVTSCY